MRLSINVPNQSLSGGSLQKETSVPMTLFQWDIPAVMVTSIPDSIQSRDEVSIIIFFSYNFVFILLTEIQICGIIAENEICRYLVIESTEILEIVNRTKKLG